jgi:hypothetical protein
MSSSARAFVPHPPAGSFRASAHTGVGIRSPPGACTGLQTCKDGGNGLPRRCAPRNDPQGDDGREFGAAQRPPPTNMDKPVCNHVGAAPLGGPVLCTDVAPGARATARVAPTELNERLCDNRVRRAGVVAPYARVHPCL